MTQAQFLIFFLVVLPFVAAGFLAVVVPYPKFQGFLGSFFSLIFLFASLKFSNAPINYFEDSLDLFSINQDLSFGLSAFPLSSFFLLITALIWFVVSCYSIGYFGISKDTRLANFQVLLAIIIGFITLIIFSKNLFTVLLFYQPLIMVSYFLNNLFLKKFADKLTYNFTFISLISCLLLFLATALTYRLVGKIEFAISGIVAYSLPFLGYLAILFLYLLGLVLVIFGPIYLFYGSLFSLNPPMLIVNFVLVFGLVSLLILLKVVTGIFGADLFLAYNQKLNHNHLISLILGINLFISALFCNLAGNLKRILIYLFFNQFIFVVFSLFIFKQQLYQVIVIISDLILLQIMIFLCVGNINIYIMSGGEKVMNGIFYKLKITTSLFIFALLGLTGLVPSIAMVSKFLLLKQIVKNHLSFEGFIILINVVLNAVCVVKIIKPMFEKTPETMSYNQELAKAIESRLTLILPLIIVAFLSIVGFLLFPLVMNFSKRVF